MKESFVPFLVAFGACAIVFLALDFGIMSLQGLSLVFHQ